MPDGELIKTITRFEERKAAAGATNTAPNSERTIKEILSGFDIDAEELAEVRSAVVASAREAMSAGLHGVAVLDGTWVDGLLTGLMLAEERNGKRGG